MDRIHPVLLDLSHLPHSWGTLWRDRDLAIGVADAMPVPDALPTVAMPTGSGIAEGPSFAPGDRVFPVIPIGIVGLSSHERASRWAGLPGQAETLCRLFGGGPYAPIG